MSFYPLIQLLQSYIAAFGAALIWGLSPVIIFRVSQLYSSTFITILRNIGSLAIAFAASIYIVSDLYSISIYMIAIMLLIGILGPGIGDQLYTISISRIGSSLSIIFAYTYVMWSQLFAVVSGLEAITVRSVIGALISICGLYIVVSTYSGLTIPGERGVFIVGALSSLSAGVLWGLATVLSKIAALNADPSIIIMVRSIGAIIVVLLTGLVISANNYIGITKNNSIIYRIIYKEKRDEALKNTAINIKSAVAIAVFSGILAFYIAYYLFLLALVEIGITLTTAITLFSPIVTVIMSRLLIREKLRLKTIAGILIVVAGLIIIAI